MNQKLLEAAHRGRKIRRKVSYMFILYCIILFCCCIASLYLGNFNNLFHTFFCGAERPNGRMNKELLIYNIFIMWGHKNKKTSETLCGDLVSTGVFFIIVGVYFLGRDFGIFTGQTPFFPFLMIVVGVYYLAKSVIADKA